MPRPPRVLPTRPPGREWLNGPLVWATDEQHAILYLFPRDCPRILVWPMTRTTSEDRAAWMGTTGARGVSRTTVRPAAVETLNTLDARLAAAGVEVRALDRLAPLRPVWSSTLHASGIRLRNAAGWA